MTENLELTYTPVHEVLEAEPREFNIDDVRAVQEYLLFVKDELDRTNEVKVPIEEEFYKQITGLFNVDREESYADQDAYSLAINKLLTTWAKNKGIISRQPQTLEETVQAHIEFPQLDEFSPINFRGKAKSPTIGYVQIDCGKALEIEREDSELRYYLNPSSEYIGDVVDEIISRALDEGIPLYFKFINLSLGHPTAYTLYRSERIIIYASHNQQDFINGLIKDLEEKKPEAFSGRNTSGFGEVMGEGISRGDEVTAVQNEKFQRQESGISFNGLRSKLIYVATMEVTKSLISSAMKDPQIIDGKSISQIFSNNLNKVFEFNGESETVLPSDPEIEKALDQSFAISEDENTESSKYIDEVEQAIKLTAAELLPLLSPNELLERYKKVLSVKAPEFGINPNNLARNL